MKKLSKNHGPLALGNTLELSQTWPLLGPIKQYRPFYSDALLCNFIYIKNNFGFGVQFGIWSNLVGAEAAGGNGDSLELPLPRLWQLFGHP